MRKLFKQGVLALAATTLLACGSTIDAPAERTSPETTQSEEGLYASLGAIWPGSVVRVCWMSPRIEHVMQREWTRDHVQKTWGAHSRVEFVGWNTCAPQSDVPEIRIRVADERPWSQVGPSKGSAATMTLNFAFQSWSQDCQSSLEHCVRALAMHEFGHAIGFWHEQSRADTPDGACAAGTEGVRTAPGDAYLTPWDKESVMNYCSTSWINNGQLTDWDKHGVRTVYGSVPNSVRDVRGFEPHAYLLLNPDLAQTFGADRAAGSAHFENYGRHEGRVISLAFDSRLYLARHGDLAATYGSTNYAAAWTHWLANGIREGRSGSRIFDPKYYLQRHPDLAANLGAQNWEAALRHYLQYGVFEGRQASPSFDPKYYLSANADVRSSHGADNYFRAAIHYLAFGLKEGRRGTP